MRFADLMSGKEDINIFDISFVEGAVLNKKLRATSSGLSTNAIFGGLHLS
jgi:hypothetical protein